MTLKMTLNASSALAGIGLALLSFAGTADAAPKPRTIVTTDIETDDYNSMIRYLLYTNDVDTAGIVYGSSRFHWAGDGKGTKAKAQGGSAEVTSWRWTGTTHIQELIEEYRKAYPNLRVHDPAYPTPDHLLGLIKIGNIEFEGDMAGETEGSEWIRATLLDDVPGPLFLQAWGGTNTIARALKSIEERYKGRAEWQEIRRRVSRKAVIYTWGKQDSTYDTYIAKVWPDIQTNDIRLNAWGYRVRGEASTNVLPQDRVYFNAPWTRANVLNVGPLGAKYRVWGDRRSFEGDQEDTFGLVPYPGRPLRQGFPYGTFVSEGDTPTFLNLLDNGLRAYEQPDYGGWAGRLVKGAGAATNFWSAATDERDPSGQVVDNYTSKRWVAFAQRDFANRLQWSVTPTYRGANHPPLVKVAGGLARTAKPGERVVLRGVASDPDRDGLETRWWQYREAGSYPADVRLEERGQTAVFLVPADAKPGQTLHMMFEVSDTGAPSLTRWQRVIVTVS